MERLATECRFGCLPDVNRDAVEHWLVRQSRKSNEQSRLSARTRNYYRAAVVAFCNWCVETGRLSHNPLNRVAKANEEVDRRRQRRALSELELERLLVVARLRPLAEYGRTTVRLAKPADNRKRSGWTYAPLHFDDLPAACEVARQRLQKRPAFVTELERIGNERALIYKTLVLSACARVSFSR